LTGRANIFPKTGFVGAQKRKKEKKKRNTDTENDKSSTSKEAKHK
jgi:hypothetical protein